MDVMPTGAIVVTQLADTRVVAIVRQSRQLLEEMRTLGFSPEGELLVRSVSGEQERIDLTGRLMELKALFSGGPGWSPCAVVSYDHEQGKLKGHTRRLFGGIQLHSKSSITASSQPWKRGEAKRTHLDDLTTNAVSLADALGSLTATIHAALLKYEQAPTPELDYAAKKWRNTAFRLLQADLEGLQSALGHPESSASIQAFVTIGGNEVGLAKNLDSFRFDFAGPVFEKQLNHGVDAVVHAASALVHSIGVEQRLRVPQVSL